MTAKFAELFGRGLHAPFFIAKSWLWYDKNMEANEYYDFEDRRYVNPTISRDEQMAFIDNLRNTQTANNEQIQTDTYNLGTHIPMTQGGLATGATDPDSYFMQRYQTPQVDSQVATLKATAQAQALNDVLSNYQKQMKKRYSDAYKNYKKRYGGTGAGGTPDTLYPETGGGVDDKVLTPLGTDYATGNQYPGTEVTQDGRSMWVTDLNTGTKKHYEKKYDANGNPYWDDVTNTWTKTTNGLEQHIGSGIDGAVQTIGDKAKRFSDTWNYLMGTLGQATPKNSKTGGSAW